MSGFDVIVIGGGHAGCEAAAASARLGARTLLLTHSFETIGEMSCNPAIGGVGKGHLVREIDALDGLMGRVADAAGIQFRLLNRRKGPAVRGPARPGRSQALPRGDAGRMLRRQPESGIRSRPRAEDLIVERRPRQPASSPPTGADLAAGAVVLTTGTFLSGLIHIGETQDSGRRAVGEAPAPRPVRRALRLGLAHGPAQDRHAAAAGRPHHRLGRRSRCSRAMIRPCPSRS